MLSLFSFSLSFLFSKYDRSKVTLCLQHSRSTCGHVDVLHRKAHLRIDDYGGKGEFLIFWGKLHDRREFCWSELWSEV